MEGDCKESNIFLVSLFPIIIIRNNFLSISWNVKEYRIEQSQKKV